jgi:hypothetical protein
MASAQDVAKQIEEFLDEEISLEELEDWSASFAWDTYASHDQDAGRAALFLRSILNAYDGDQSDIGLRRELEKIVRPFALDAERLRAMDARERSARLAMAKAAVALLLLIPATGPQLVHSSKALEPVPEMVEV